MNLLSSSVAFTPKNDGSERFVEKYSFEQRETQSAKIRAQFPDRVLVILEPAPRTTTALVSGNIKTKFLVPGEQTVGKFIANFRSQLKLPQEQGIYLFTLENTLPAVSMTMSQLDSQHRSKDGFLYLVYSGENTFGQK